MDWLSLMVGAIATSAAALLIVVRDDPPRHVVKWRLGAEGERKPEKGLLSLERLGWVVEHDVERPGRANLDHVVGGPPGVFLLETKNFEGTITVEDGVLVARQFDDPDEVYRYGALASRLRGQASELSARLRRETGRRVWVTAIVVIWGHFPSGQIESENVAYIDGDQLANWLASRPVPT
jgi:Nuclease-related domain